MTVRGGFRGGAANRPHPPEHIFAPPWAYFRTPQTPEPSAFYKFKFFKKINNIHHYRMILRCIIFLSISYGIICIIWNFQEFAFAGWPEYMYSVYPTSDSIPKHLWICMIFGGIRKIFNPVFFHSLLDQEFDRKGFCMLFVMLLPSPVKVLYTSETTLTPRALWITSWN